MALLAPPPPLPKAAPAAAKDSPIQHIDPGTIDLIGKEGELAPNHVKICYTVEGKGRLELTVPREELLKWCKSTGSNVLTLQELGAAIGAEISQRNGGASYLVDHANGLYRASPALESLLEISSKVDGGGLELSVTRNSIAHTKLNQLVERARDNLAMARDRPLPAIPNDKGEGPKWEKILADVRAKQQQLAELAAASNAKGQNHAIIRTPDRRIVDREAAKYWPPLQRGVKATPFISSSEEKRDARPSNSSASARIGRFFRRTSLWSAAMGVVALFSTAPKDSTSGIDKLHREDSAAASKTSEVRQAQKTFERRVIPIQFRAGLVELRPVPNFRAGLVALRQDDGTFNPPEPLNVVSSGDPILPDNLKDLSAGFNDGDLFGGVVIPERQYSKRPWKPTPKRLGKEEKDNGIGKLAKK